MKKLFCILVTLLLVVLGCAALAENPDVPEDAVDYEFGDYTYNITTDGTVCIKQYASFSDKKTLKVPETMDGMPVTAINMYAFSGCTASKIELPEGITFIGEGAFSFCDALKTINLPETLTTLCDGAFEECASLKEIVIPEGMEELPARCFMSCYELKTVTLPESMLRINNAAFYDCAALKTVDIKEGLQVIDLAAFNGCASLKKVVLPSTLLELGDMAFADCYALRSINLPAGMTYIGNDIVKDCYDVVITVADADSYAAIICEDFHLPYKVAAE